jgi:hypothetical protein
MLTSMVQLVLDANEPESGVPTSTLKEDSLMEKKRTFIQNSSTLDNLLMENSITTITEATLIWGLTFQIGGVDIKTAWLLLVFMPVLVRFNGKKKLLI